MTDSSIIQDARDVLAKWRDNDVLLWHYDEHGTVLDSTGAAVVIGATEGDARLIVGTAGNPELLDAIDTLLTAVVAYGYPADPYERGVSEVARNIAAAILAANERMSA
jgi:hypothetical protein